MNHYWPVRRLRVSRLKWPFAGPNWTPARHCREEDFGPHKSERRDAMAMRSLARGHSEVVAGNGLFSRQVGSGTGGSKKENIKQK